MPLVTSAQVLAQIPGLDLGDAANATRLIADAERDVAGLFPATLDASHAIDTAGWSAWETTALQRAVCLQVEWLVLNPRAARAGAPQAAQITSVKGPDFTKTYAPASTGRPKRFGPLVRAELEQLRPRRALTGRAVA